MAEEHSMDPKLVDMNGKPLDKGIPMHEFCNVCGWRKGGVDSWDGNRCKCGHGGPVLYYRQWPLDGGWVR